MAKVKSSTGVRTWMAIITLALAFLGGYGLTIRDLTKAEACMKENEKDIKYIQTNGHEMKAMLHKIDRQQATIEANQHLVMTKLGINHP